MKKTLTSAKYLLPAVLIAMMSCNTSNNNPTKIQRTYPQAFNYRTVSFRSFKNDITPPDSINIKAYVLAISECPPNASCFSLDGVIISDSLHPTLEKSKYRLTVNKPDQFKENAFYELSLKIGTYPGNGERDVELAGYNLLKWQDIVK
jgi:hypothetical protein